MFNKDISKNIKAPGIPGLDSESNQKFFGIILTILALSFFGFFAIRPTISTIAKLDKEIKDNEFVLSEQEAKISNLNQLEAQYNKLGSDIEIVTNAVTIKPEITLLFGQIQTLCKNYGINLVSLQNYEVPIVAAGKEEQNYSYSFELIGTGTIEDIYKFTEKISNIERVINIESFTLNYVQDQQTEGLQITIRGAAYFMK